MKPLGYNLNPVAVSPCHVGNNACAIESAAFRYLMSLQQREYTHSTWSKWSFRAVEYKAPELALSFTEMGDRGIEWSGRGRGRVWCWRWFTRVRGWSEFASVRFSKIAARESCEKRGRGGRESNLRLWMNGWTDGWMDDKNHPVQGMNNYRSSVENEVWNLGESVPRAVHRGSEVPSRLRPICAILAVQSMEVRIHHKSQVPSPKYAMSAYMTTLCEGKAWDLCWELGRAKTWPNSQHKICECFCIK